ASPMLRGSSSFAGRWRNFNIRLACVASSLLRSRSADSDSSTACGMAFDYIFERHGSLFARTHSPESSFGKVQIFEILNVFEYGLTHIEGFGTTGTPRELVQALF